MSGTIRFLFVAVAGVAWLGAAPPSTVRYYTASITPTGVNAGITNSYTLTIENSPTTSANQNFGSATVAVPAGFVVDPGSLSASATGGKSWTATLSGSTIILGAVQGTDKVDPGESLTLAFNANAPCSGGSYEWTTAVYQDTLSGGAVVTTTPYTLIGSQPTVGVSGSCSTGFQPGQYCTYSQGGWGADPNGGNPGQILASNFGTVYPSGVSVGSPNSMAFDSAAVVDAYLPAGGRPGQLNANLVDPTSTPAGVFGGQVLALQLNVDFNNAGIVVGTAGSISSLKLSGGSLSGDTVAQILSAAETALGGGAVPSGYTLSTLNTLITNLNESFEACVPSDWAQANLTQ